MAKRYFSQAWQKSEIDAVIEQIEEIAHGAVTSAHAVDHQAAVRQREYAQRAGQPHEVHGKRDRAGGGAGKRLDFTGREAHRRVRAETHGFVARIGKTSDYLPLGTHPLQQTDGLEELEVPGFPVERPGDGPALGIDGPGSPGGGGYIRILRPARGGHCLSTSFRWRERTRSWLKLLMET